MLIRVCVTTVLLLVSQVLASPSATAQQSSASNLPGFGNETPTTQESLPATDPLLLGDPTLQSQSGQPQQKSNWLVESPLGKVGWPELKMPKVEFNPPWKSEPGQPNWFARQADKARSSARTAAVKTRDAWNGSLDKMKMVLPGHGTKNTGQLASDQQQPGFWQRLMKPGTAQPPIEDVPMIAHEPEATTRR